MPESSQSSRIDVLLIESQGGGAPSTRELLPAPFQASCDLRQVHSFGEALDYVRAHQPSVILLSLLVPDTASYEAVRAMRNAGPGCALIAITRADDEAAALAALRAGVHEVWAASSQAGLDLPGVVTRALARAAAACEPPVSRLVHNLNNLVTSVNGFADLLLTRLGPDDPSRSSVEQIHKAGSRAAALVRSFSTDSTSSSAPASSASNTTPRAA